MALETFDYIDSLNTANPTATDNVSQGDDHIRGIKTTLVNSFPGVDGAVNSTDTEMNSLDMSASGSTAGDVLTSTGTGTAPTWQEIVSFDSGTKIVFAQASAPTGWTQDTTNNDKALRVVSGTGGGTGGTHAMSSPPSTSHTHTGASHTHSTPNHSHSHSLSAGSHTLSTSQMPSHTHSITTYTYGMSGPAASPSKSWGSAGSVGTSSAGGSSSHSHSLSGSISSGGSGTTGSGGTGTTSSAGPTAFAPQYIDVIVCSKD